MASERKVPVLKSDNSLIEQEFDSVREKFESEMMKMEEEMARFRSQLIGSELSSSRSCASSLASSSLKTTKMTSSTKTTRISDANKSSQIEAQAGIRNYNTTSKEELKSNNKPTAVEWLNELSSPLIVDNNNDEGKMLKLRFDVTAYEPEEIVVKTVDNRLYIHARREERSENKSSFSEYNREFLLPDGVEPELIRSSLSADGVLTVEAPLPRLKP